MWRQEGWRRQGTAVGRSKDSQSSAAGTRAQPNFCVEGRRHVCSSAQHVHVKTEDHWAPRHPRAGQAAYHQKEVMEVRVPGPVRRKGPGLGAPHLSSSRTCTAPIVQARDPHPLPT